MIKTRTNTKGKLMDYNNGQNNWQPNVPPMQNQQNPMMQNQQALSQTQMYQTYVQQEMERDKKANTLCIISLILAAAGVFIIPAISAATGSFFTVDPSSSEVMQEIVETANLFPAFGSGFCTLAALVLMIIARVNYPKNKFAKILMWVYITAIAVEVLITIALIVTCIYFLNQCIP